MNDCPFCQRIKNQDYDAKLGDVVTFEPLNPVTLGHRLFVPNWHVEFGDTGDGPMIGRCMFEATFWARRSRMLTEQFNLIASCGNHATQTIDHIHIHLVPRRRGDGLRLPWRNR